MLLNAQHVKKLLNVIKNVLSMINFSMLHMKNARIRKH